MEGRFKHLLIDAKNHVDASYDVDGLCRGVFLERMQAFERLQRRRFKALKGCPKAFKKFEVEYANAWPVAFLFQFRFFYVDFGIKHAKHVRFALKLSERVSQSKT